MENYNIAHCNYANDAQLCIIVSPRDCSSVYLLIVFGDYQAKPKIKDKSAFTLHYKISTICELFQVAIRESGWCITDAQISNRWNNLTCCDFKSRNMKCVKVKKKKNAIVKLIWIGMDETTSWWWYVEYLLSPTNIICQTKSKNPYIEINLVYCLYALFFNYLSSLYYIPPFGNCQTPHVPFLCMLDWRNKLLLTDCTDYTLHWRFILQEF